MRRRMRAGLPTLSGSPTQKPAPEYPFAGNAGQRDPRGAAAAYSPGPSDLRPATELRRIIRTGMPQEIPPGRPPGLIPQNQVDTDAPPIATGGGPEQTVEAVWPALILAQGVANAVQITPKNTQRRALKVANPTPNGLIAFSFNSPVQLEQLGMGIPVDPQSSYEPQNGTVSIDPIYVWSDDSTATFPIACVVFEGVPVSS